MVVVVVDCKVDGWVIDLRSRFVVGARYGTHGSGSGNGNGNESFLYEWLAEDNASCQLREFLLDRKNSCLSLAMLSCMLEILRQILLYTCSSFTIVFHLFLGPVPDTVLRSMISLRHLPSLPLMLLRQQCGKSDKCLLPRSLSTVR